MKLGKTSWMILTVGMFVIAFASVGAARSQKIEEQNRLYEELSLAEEGLANIQLEPLLVRQDELVKRLSQSVSQLEAARAELSRSRGIIAVTDSLLSIAEASGVEITDISSSGLANGALEGLAFSVLPVNARVEGSVPGLIDFIAAVNGDFADGVVKTTDITVSRNVTDGRSVADIRMLIYSYQGK